MPLRLGHADLHNRETLLGHERESARDSMVVKASDHAEQAPQPRLVGCTEGVPRGNPATGHCLIPQDKSVSDISTGLAAVGHQIGQCVDLKGRKRYESRLS